MTPVGGFGFYASRVGSREYFLRWPQKLRRSPSFQNSGQSSTKTLLPNDHLIERGTLLPFQIFFQVVPPSIVLSILPIRYSKHPSQYLRKARSRSETSVPHIYARAISKHGYLVLVWALKASVHRLSTIREE